MNRWQVRIRHRVVVWVLLTILIQRWHVWAEVGLPLTVSVREKVVRLVDCLRPSHVHTRVVLLHILRLSSIFRQREHVLLPVRTTSLGQANPWHLLLADTLVHDRSSTTWPGYRLNIRQEALCLTYVVILDAIVGTLLCPIVCRASVVRRLEEGWILVDEAVLVLELTAELLNHRHLVTAKLLLIESIWILGVESVAGRVDVRVAADVAHVAMGLIVGKGGIVARDLVRVRHLLVH